MPHGIYDSAAPHGEASRLVAFSQNRLDRQSEHRTEDDLPTAVAEPETRYFAICGGRLVMRVGAEKPVGLLTGSELEALEPDTANAILLGRTETGAARIAISVACEADALPDVYKAIDSRSIYRQQLLKPETLGAYAQANSLIHWGITNRHCGRCGGTMLVEAGGYRRKCEKCNGVVFPRTDPVVIMLVTDATTDRCLLGRSAHFPEGMYSALAGFVEPGETLEDAVRRETFEESGIKVGRVRYHASQPWPMPHTLMIGVFAEGLSVDIVRDTIELTDCRWFSREETEAMLQSSAGVSDGETPPPGAIAHRLMRDWLDWPSK